MSDINYEYEYKKLVAFLNDHQAICEKQAELIEITTPSPAKNSRYEWFCVQAETIKFIKSMNSLGD